MIETGLFDAARHAACIALTTRDRVDVTVQALPGLAFEAGFDLIWLDGSATDAGRALPRTLAPNMPHLRAIIGEVGGGPDVAILTALSRMLALGYDYCGLIENDIRLETGWFAALMALFDAGAADGLAVGAVSARAFESRLLVKRPGYAVPMITGAGMVLFSRAAARLVLDHYRTPSTAELRSWFLYASGRDTALFGEAAFRQGPGSDVALASDYQYDMILQRHGLATLATLPVRATDLEAGGVRAETLGGYAAPASPDVEADAVFATLRARLAAQRAQAVPWAPPWLHSPVLNGWIVFAHQLLHMAGSPARLSGRWRWRWSKFHGPFLLETDDPGATVTFPLVGRLCGLGIEAGPDSAAVALTRAGQPAALVDARAPAAYPRYVPLAVEAAGADTVTIAPGGAGVLRLFGVCFAEPPPWLSHALDADALIAGFGALS